MLKSVTVSCHGDIVAFEAGEKRNASLLDDAAVTVSFTWALSENVSTDEVTLSWDGPTETVTPLP